MKYLKTNIINLLKGIGIGIANVIPGFSGGSMAVILHIYDLFVYCLANIFNNFLEVIKKGWSLFLGIIIGVLIALVSIVKLLEIAPFITSMFFVGLVIGSLNDIKDNIKGERLKFYDILVFLVSIIIMIIIPLLKEKEAIINYDFKLYLIIFILGIICASAMVIPGISGSMLLMAFGYYSFIMLTIKDFLYNLLNFNYSNYLNNILVLAFFAIGIIIGLVFISKLIRYLLNKRKRTVFASILGLLLASPFSIIYLTIKDYNVNLSILPFILGMISLFIGALLSYLLVKISKTNKE